MIRLNRMEGNYLEVDKQLTSTLENIPINKIYPNPYQPRKIFSEDSLTELSNSIRQVGLLQPITVRKLGQNYFELVAGERRLRASKLAGYTHIKALIVEAVVEQDIAMLAMVENLQRDNLNFFEEAEGYQTLIREHGLTQEDLAKKLSKNQSTIANKLRILKLPRTVKERILEHNLTERHARALLRLHNEVAQLQLLDKIIAQKLSVKTTEDLVENELRKLYGDGHEKEGKVIKLKCNYSIYYNTIKRTVSKISAMGINTEMKYQESDTSFDIIIRLRK